MTVELPEHNPMAYRDSEEEWSSLVSESDEKIGQQLVNGEDADKLIGVPFIITRVVFRDGVQLKGVAYRSDYVSCEAVVAPASVLTKQLRRHRVSSIDDLPVDPGEHIIFNDGSTGIYRQITEYLAVKGFIELPDGPVTGAKGESIYDLPRSQWVNPQDETSEFNVRLFCPRGIRVSEYANEYTSDGQTTQTRYIA